MTRKMLGLWRDRPRTYQVPHESISTISNRSNSGRGGLGLGKISFPGLNDAVQYPGTVQSVASTIPIPRRELFIDGALSRIYEFHGAVVEPLYLRATDPDAHVAFNAAINSCEALTLVDSGATGILCIPSLRRSAVLLYEPRPNRERFG